MDFFTRIPKADDKICYCPLQAIFFSSLMITESNTEAAAIIPLGSTATVELCRTDSVRGDCAYFNSSLNYYPMIY